MSILDKSSLVMIPSGYNEDKLYSVKPRNGDGDFTFTRASTGTRVNADGYIEEVAWNYNTNSEDLNSHTKLNVVVTSNDIISPRGTQDADKLETTSNNSYKLLKTNSVSFVSGTDYTFSFFAKKGTTDFIQLITTNTLFGATSEWANFDLNNGVVSLDNYGGASIEDVSNGWYRCKMTSTCVSSGTDGWFVSVITSGSSARAEYTTNVVNVYVWGLQVVKGNAPKPYIKTTDRLDIPRLDYSGGATNPTLLLQPQRTNKSYNSEDWTASGYIYNNCTATANQAISPDNTQTADQLDFGSGSGFFYENVTSITAASTYSVFIKYINYQFVQIIGTGDANHYANFDIQNGVVGNTGSASTASIEDYGNGWYRCIINYNSGTFAGTARLYKVASLTANFAQGGGAAGSFYFWGNQMEVGTFVTSYIPSTSGTSTTRVADVSETSGLSDYIGQSEGSFILDFKCPSGGGGQIYIWDGTLQNRLLLNFYSSNTRIDALAIVGNTLMANENLFDQDTTQRTIYGVRYRENDFEVWVNGVLKATESGTFNFWSAGTLDQLDFNAYNDTAKFSGNVNKVIFTTTYPTDDEMEQLTTL